MAAKSLLISLLILPFTILLTSATEFSEVNGYNWTFEGTNFYSGQCINFRGRFKFAGNDRIKRESAQIKVKEHCSTIFRLIEKLFRNFFIICVSRNS